MMLTIINKLKNVPGKIKNVIFTTDLFWKQKMVFSLISPLSWVIYRDPKWLTILSLVIMVVRFFSNKLWNYIITCDFDFTPPRNRKTVRNSWSTPVFADWTAPLISLTFACSIFDQNSDLPSILRLRLLLLHVYVHQSEHNCRVLGTDFFNSGSTHAAERPTFYFNHWSAYHSSGSGD